MQHNLGKLILKFVVLPYQSLGVSVTAIAESAVSLGGLYTTSIILNTTIRGVRDLSVVQCSSFLDLLANKIECVH
jgi:hypothetical protein